MKLFPNWIKTIKDSFTKEQILNLKGKNNEICHWFWSLYGKYLYGKENSPNPFSMIVHTEKDENTIKGLVTTDKLIEMYENR